MSKRNQVVFRVLAAVTTILAVVLLSHFAEAHAILKQSSPATNSTVAGPDVPITLQFNVRIDALRSKLQLLNPDATTTDLLIDQQPSPDTLVTKAKGLKAGAYRIRWQVLAPDGHITRGEIPFTVTGS
ncbi:MAG TPA: copper resistance CopC family protein [Verrucomicrobiae bacterium]|nr:copper resistance CopC family protein [Verrucomicrobiae bacterium]